MSQTYSLDGVLRRIDPSVESDRYEPNEQLVMLDTASRRILERAPRFRLGRHLRYFLVTTDRRVDIAGPTCRIKSPSTSRWLELQIAYEAWCPAGNENKMVLTLGMVDHPGHQLAQVIRRCVKHYEQLRRTEGRDMALEFPELRSDLEGEICRRVAQDTGLGLTTEVRPRLEDKLGAVCIETGPIEVRPTDSDRPILVQAATEAEVEPSRTMYALLHYGALSDLTEQIRESIRRQVADSITLQEFFERRSGMIEERLIEGINTSLLPLGRCVKYLRLEGGAEREPQEMEEIEHSISCSIRDLEEQVVVRHKMIVRLENLGKFVRSGVSDIKAWICECLGQVTRSILFDKIYLNLLTGTFADDIKKTVEAEAKQVGYAIQHMVTVPDLEPLTWKDGFEVACQDACFSTMDSRIEVRMEIVLHGRIPERELGHPTLKPYLRPKSEIFEDMKKAALAEARRVLHGVHPQRYYMGFNRPFGDDSESVREQLERHLGNLLEERFRIHDLSVIPKPLDTDLTDRVAVLMREPQYLKVPCSSLHLGEEAVFHLEFQIVGIAEWYHFCSRQRIPIDDELLGIRKVLAEETRSVFGSVPSEILLYRDRATQVQLARLLGGCWEKIRQGFGLEIRLTNLRRDLTTGEMGRQEEIGKNISHAMAIEESRRRARHERLAHLYERELELLRDGRDPDDPELEAAAKRIDGIHKDLAAFTGQEKGRAVPLLPESRATFRVEDYRQPLFPEIDDTGKLNRGETHELPSGEDSDP